MVQTLIAYKIFMLQDQYSMDARKSDNIPECSSSPQSQKVKNSSHNCTIKGIGVPVLILLCAFPIPKSSIVLVIANVFMLLFKWAC